MKLLEHQAKELLAMNGVALPKNQLFELPVMKPTLPFPLVLKVQIPTGGRGKAGGIRIARNQTDFDELFPLLFNQKYLGHVSRNLLAEELLSIAKEFYIAFIIDRSSQSIVLLAHAQGGVDIEDAATADAPLLHIPLESAPGSAVASKLLSYYNLSKDMQPQLLTMLRQLYELFVNEDILLLEINPLVVTRDNKLICADTKIELDDAAAYRHGEHWPQQAVQQAFVTLVKDKTKQSIGSMANGAGLAMATVDAIKASGAEPANFLDIGGGTSSKHMIDAFKKISAIPNVSSIVVNIFGGITRCDDVARAIITAKNEVASLPPLYIRLTGTNEATGKKLLSEAGIPLYPSLTACIKKAIAHV